MSLFTCVRFFAQAHYQVQYKTNLSQLNWINLGTAVVAPGSSLTISDTNNVSSSSQRFYRLCRFTVKTGFAPNRVDVKVNGIVIA